MFARWDEIDKGENDEDFDEEKESLNCFMALFDETKMLKSNLDNCIDQYDLPSYDDSLNILIYYMKI